MFSKKITHDRQRYHRLYYRKNRLKILERSRLSSNHKPCTRRFDFNAYFAKKQKEMDAHMVCVMFD